MADLRFDQSTFLAHRAREAAKIGPPKPPQHVALPGAKAAVAHDRLLAYQDAELDSDAITERVNERWRAENAELLAEHSRWVAGPYVAALEDARKAEIEAAAKALRTRALFEEIMREREQGS